MRLFLPAVFSILFLAGTTFSEDCNGSVEYIGDIRILNLWGTWEEMGYAHGYLMGPDIGAVFHDYFLEMAGGVDNYEMARTYFQTYFDVPSEFEDYAQGMVTGIADTVTLYSDSLERNIDYIDICVVSATPDISALKGFEGFQCSSVSSWGDATSSDPDLSGSPAISRNLDYYVDTHGTILDHNILVTLDPDDGQEWVSIGFPGFSGCLSGMNESGASAALNMGNHQGTSQYGDPFVPICMAQALGLSGSDINSSGSFDVEDMKYALTNWHRSNSYAIHVVADRNLAGLDSASVVVEINNHDGFAYRYSTDEPDIGPCRMILTNHHRVLIPPVSCYRYNYMMDSLTTNPDVTLDRLWNFMGAVGWPASPGSGGTIQTMIFMPEQLQMALAFATPSTPSYQQDPEWIEWSDIFPNHSSQGIEGSSPDDPYIHAAPNPSADLVFLDFPESTGQIFVYDSSGRMVEAGVTRTGSDSAEVDFTNLPGGMYTISVTVGGLTASREVVILH